MLEQLDRIERDAQGELEGVDDLDALDEWRVAYLGRRGEVTQLLRSIGDLPPEERPEAGQRANEVKETLQAAYDAKTDELKRRELEQALKEERVDVTLPGRPVSPGGWHISVQTLYEIYDIFRGMGFQVVETPEVELDEYNFTMLNIPPYHPAREMQDTFYTTDPEVLLRTHTSPGQIHVMREAVAGADDPENLPPIRVILPGKCYRYEQITPRAEVQFYQVEGLAVGENITMADLKGTLIEWARMTFGEDTGVRFRASYFPFTEPSAEMDIACILCEGGGCRVCKHTGWLEILGCGMVHPQVLRNGGYDPDRYGGYAFGMGPERIAMLKYGINDIRNFFTGDLRFLEQF